MSNARPQSSLVISIDKIEEGLYLGNGKASTSKSVLLEYNIIAVVSLSDNRKNPWNQPWYKSIIREGSHLLIPCKDNMTQDLLPRFAEICDLIDKHRREQPEKAVFVHCEYGISRSPTAVIAYLMRSHRWSLDEALEYVAARRKIRPNQNFKEQLKVWEQLEYEIWEEGGEDGGDKVPKPAYAAYLETRAERLKEAGLTGNEPIFIQSL